MPLSETEREMIQIVVDRFMRVKEPTKRKDPVTQFRSPGALDCLISLGILKALDNDGNLLLRR
jgi:hypothetical protein